MREIISYILYNFNIIYVMFIYVEPTEDSNYLMREYDFFYHMHYRLLYSEIFKIWL